MDISIAAAPVVYYHLQSVSISPSSDSATVGVDYPSTVITLTSSPADDGSYSYSWNNPHGEGSAGFTLVKNGNTATLSGTPTTAGKCVINGFVTDYYGVQKGVSLPVTVEAAPVETGTLNPDNCSHNIPASIDGTIGQRLVYKVELTLDEADDGNYENYWYLNGNGGGFGTIYSDEDRTKQLANPHGLKDFLPSGSLPINRAMTS